MMKEATVNAIFFGLLTAIGMALVELVKYNIWYVPFIVAVLSGAAVCIRIMLQNRGQGGTGGVGKMCKKGFKIGSLISCVGIM